MNRPENPVAKYRSERKISRRGLAEVTKVSESAIQQIEYGQFASIPATVHAYFESVKHQNGYSKNQVNELYKEFITWKRNQVKSGQAGFKLKPVSEFQNEWALHPFRAYLLWLNVNETHFAQQMCIPKNSFFKYIKGRQRPMPHTMRVALHDGGLSWEEINQLDTLGAEFYDKQCGRFD